MELDEEMERMQSHTQFKLEEQVCYQLIIICYTFLQPLT